MLHLLIKAISIIVLIVLPCIVIPLFLVDIFIKLTTSHYLFERLLGGWYLWYLLSVLVVVIIYGLLPIKFITKNHLSKIGYKTIVIEFEFVKKILLIGVSILTILLVYEEIFVFFPVPDFLFYTNFVMGFIFVLYTSAFLLYAGLGGGLRILTQIAKKEFRFYFAKGCCEIISKMKDEDSQVEKMKYLFLALDSYNKYLRRRLKFEIKDIEKIYSKFMYENINEKQTMIEKICKSFEDEDRLKLVEYLSIRYNIPDSELFVRESLIEKLKVFGTFLVTTIPIAISIIHLIIGK